MRQAQVSKVTKEDFADPITPEIHVDESAPFFVKFSGKQLSTNEDDPANVVCAFQRTPEPPFQLFLETELFLIPFPQVKMQWKTVPCPIEGNLLPFPKNSLTYDTPTTRWYACNTFKMNPTDKEEVAKSHCIPLRDWLAHPNVANCLECPELIADVIFKNSKGIRITEEDAVAINDKFDPTKEVAPVVRKRVFSMPSEPATAQKSSKNRVTYPWTSTAEAGSSCMPKDADPVETPAETEKPAETAKTPAAAAAKPVEKPAPKGRRGLFGR